MTLESGGNGLVVLDLLLHQSFALVNFAVAPGTQITVTNSHCPILLEGIGRPATGALGSVSISTGVTVRDSYFEGQDTFAFGVANAEVTCIGSVFRGRDAVGGSVPRAATGVVVALSEVSFAECVLVGGRALVAGATARPALESTHGTVRIGHGCRLYGGGTVALEGLASAPTNVELDPSALLVGSIQGPVTTLAKRLPVSELGFAPNLLLASLRGAGAGQRVHFVLGNGGRAFTTSLGRFWLDPGLLVTLAPVTADATGAAGTGVPVPALAGFVGLPFAMQPLVEDPTTGRLEFAMHSATLVR